MIKELVQITFILGQLILNLNFSKADYIIFIFVNILQYIGYVVKHILHEHFVVLRNITLLKLLSFKL